MPLSDYKPLTRTVELGKTSIEVRGLSFEDISIILGADPHQAAEVFQAVESAMGETIDKDTGLQIASALLTSVPDICAHALMMTIVDDSVSLEDKGRIVRSMPVPTQMKLLTDVFFATFEEVGGVKKLKEMVAPLLATIASQQEKKSKNASAATSKSQVGGSLTSSAT